jgi:molybdenum cofactor cytidylyltransferase
LGRHHDQIQDALHLTNAVFNPDYEKGMITSIQTGIRALPASTQGALLFLVDHPIVQVATIDLLIAKFEQDRIILPTFEGRRGHPVLFARKILDEIMDLPATSGANSVVRKDPSRIGEIPVSDPGITVDIDTPEEYESQKRIYE